MYVYYVVVQFSLYVLFEGIHLIGNYLCTNEASAQSRNICMTPVRPGPRVHSTEIATQVNLAQLIMYELSHVPGQIVMPRKWALIV